MDSQEFALQRAGYVGALRHPDFINAVRTGMHGRIALTYFEWAGAVREETLVSWQESMAPRPPMPSPECWKTGLCLVFAAPPSPAR